MLADAPRLSVLVTSREPLHLTGEHEYLVLPLTLPDPGQAGAAADLPGAESVTLFVQRARAASTNFQLTDENAAAVTGICLRLEGRSSNDTAASCRLCVGGITPPSFLFVNIV